MPGDYARASENSLLFTDFPVRLEGTTNTIGIGRAEINGMLCCFDGKWAKINWRCRRCAILPDAQDAIFVAHATN